MVAFSYLVPALFLNFTNQITLPLGNGSISTGGTLNLGKIIGGTLVSEPGFETQIKGTLSDANDFPTGDPDELHDRPNVLGLISTDDGEYLQMAATGIVTTNADIGKIVSGSGPGNLPFGAFQGVLVVSFRTGSGKYKNLEDSIFVASETVRSLDDKHFEAGFKISKVYSTKTDVTLQ